MGHRFRALALSMICLMLTACSSTVLKKTWRDESYAGGPPKKVLVIGVAGNPLVRRLFEDRFVLELKRLGGGTEAFPSYLLTGAGFPRDREALMAQLEARSIDAVLITRLLGREAEFSEYDVVLPHAPLNGWYDYYLRSLDYFRSSEPLRQEAFVAKLQSNLYHLATDRVIWSAVSETAYDGELEKSINSYVGTSAASLARAGLLSQ